MDTIVAVVLLPLYSLRRRRVSQVKLDEFRLPVLTCFFAHSLALLEVAFQASFLGELVQGSQRYLESALRVLASLCWSLGVFGGP